MLRALLIPLLAAAALAATAAHAGSSATTPTRVTVIGDSIASSLGDDSAARSILAAGIELDLQLAVCRRLTGDSCPYEGVRAPTLVDLLPTLRLGPAVVVATGYNDFEKTFPDTFEIVMQALRKEGIKHVLWLTYRAEREQYLSMNEVVRNATAHYPELTVVDWHVYSRSHPDWVQGDGLHLNGAGAVAMATLVHKKLDELGLVEAPRPAPAIKNKVLPVARVGRPYLARLTATGGVRPIAWTSAAGRLPAGFHLRKDGLLSGTPRVAGRRTATLRATDAQGRWSSRRFVLVVRPAA